MSLAQLQRRTKGTTPADRHASASSNANWNNWVYFRFSTTYFPQQLTNSCKNSNFFKSRVLGDTNSWLTIICPSINPTWYLLILHPDVSIIDRLHVILGGFSWWNHYQPRSTWSWCKLFSIYHEMFKHLLMIIPYVRISLLVIVPRIFWQRIPCMYPLYDYNLHNRYNQVDFFLVESIPC